MSPNILTGTWKGFYTYGPEYPPDMRILKDLFIWELYLDGEIIRGSCEDRFTRDYFNGQAATIEGTLINDELSIIKRYPYFLGMDERDETYIDKSRPGEGINYVGQLGQKFFTRRFFAQGIWDISGSFLDRHGAPYYYTCTGKWKMRKIN